MTPEERALIDEWMAERSITDLASLVGYLNGEVSEALLDFECDGLHSEDLYEGEALTAALALAIEDGADDIAREAKADTLWLHAPLVAGRLLQHPAVRRAFGGS